MKLTNIINEEREDYVVVDKRNFKPLMMNHRDGFYEKWSTEEKAQADANELNNAYKKTYGAVEGPHVVMYKSDYFTEKRKNELMEGKKWSKKYKDSIDCNNPKGFSQKAHCAGKRKKESKMSLKLDELVGKPITEAQFDAAAGKKDACYHKVKARYDVWPSAYASGALVKCRKVGAANWGNKSKKKEGVNEAPDHDLAMKFKKVDDTILKLISRYKNKANVEAIVNSWMKGLHAKLKKQGIHESVKKSINEANYTHNYPSITAMAKDYKRIFPSTGPAGGVKIISGSKREATGKRSQPAFIRIEGDKKLIDA